MIMQSKKCCMALILPILLNVGGKTEDISTLSLEEIVAFHSTFYTTSNITVLLTGNFTFTP